MRDALFRRLRVASPGVHLIAPSQLCACLIGVFLQLKKTFNPNALELNGTYDKHYNDHLRAAHDRMNNMLAYSPPLHPTFEHPALAICSLPHKQRTHAPHACANYARARFTRLGPSLQPLQHLDRATSNSRRANEMAVAFHPRRHEHVTRVLDAWLTCLIGCVAMGYDK